MSKVLALLLIICFVGPLAPARVGDEDQDVLIRAMRAELGRSLAQLKLPDLEKPYFIEYTLDDAEVYNASATFGALTGAGRTRFRFFNPLVRVGSYDSDNLGFFSYGGGFRYSGGNGLVVEDDELALRRDLWLATDAAYKQAAEQFASKATYLQNKIVEEKLPDFTKAEPTTLVGPRNTLQIDEARWAKSVREWSGLFRQFPEIQDSSVTFEARAGTSYLLNTEGTLLRRPFALYTLTIQASAQAADGMNLGHALPIMALSLNELPSDAEVAQSVKQVATELTALRNAPVFDAKYLGPALLDNQAAAEFFLQMLAPNLSGERPSLLEGDYGGSGGRLEFADRLNRPVLSKFLSAYDDPRQEKEGNAPLFGSYTLDDQATKAQRINIIENGLLRNLLMSRRPRKEFTQSNGHARAASLGTARAQISNFFVRARDGKSDAELKQDLIKTCKELELPFCVRIKTLTPDPGPSGGVLSSPILAYKVYPDGREELVRGVQMGEVTLRMLRDITSAGRDNFLYNTTLAGDFWRGGLPISLSVPTILVEEMEMKKASGTKQKPALLTHPYFK